MTRQLSNTTSETHDDHAPRPTSTEVQELSLETVFDILSNQRRRYVLHYLESEGGPVTLRELSEQVAAWENDCRRSDVTPKQRKRVYTGLYQTHLPKMRDSGVVNYDPTGGVVESTDRIEAFDISLEPGHRREFGWQNYYLGLGALGTVLGTAVVIGLFPFTLLPGVAYVILFAIVLLTSAVLHVLDDRRNRIGSGTEPAELRPPDVD